MSSKLVVEIWNCPYGDAGTILVLMALADQANDKGEYEADMATIAKRARQSERNCRYLLRRLEAIEIVERLEQRGRGHKNSYRVCTENLQNLQKVQPLQVLIPAHPTSSVDVKPAKGATIAGLWPGNTKPAKPAKPATSAGLESSSTISPDLSQDLGDNPNQDPPPIVPPGDGKLQEQEKPIMPQKPIKKKTSLNTAYTPGFMKWWAVYPPDRRVDKPKCFGTWQELGLEERTEELVMKIERLKRTTWRRSGADRTYIKTSLPYLTGGRFEDELVPLEYDGKPTSTSFVTRSQREAEAIRQFVTGGPDGGSTRPPTLRDSDEPIIDDVEYRRVDP